MPASSFYAGLACLIGALWLSAAPTLAAVGCGIIPHDHLLLGGAGAPELAEHLAEEAACAAGRQTAGAASAHVQGTILSIFHVEPQQSPSGSVLSLDQLALVIPSLLTVCGLLLSFVWPLPSYPLAGRSLIPPPVDPPPEACESYVKL